MGGRTTWQERYLDASNEWKNSSASTFQGSILKVETLEKISSVYLNWVLCEYEIGLRRMETSAPKTAFSSGTWTLPALSRGLLYIMQMKLTELQGRPALICYDLRKE